MLSGCLEPLRRGLSRGAGAAFGGASGLTAGALSGGSRAGPARRCVGSRSPGWKRSGRLWFSQSYSSAERLFPSWGLEHERGPPPRAQHLQHDWPKCRDKGCPTPYTRRAGGGLAELAAGPVPPVGCAPRGRSCVYRRERRLATCSPSPTFRRSPDGARVSGPRSTLRPGACWPPPQPLY